MPRTQPIEARRLPPELRPQLLSPTTALKYAWTGVTGTVEKRVQAEEGMGKGQSHFRVRFECPRCGEGHFVDSQKAHGKLAHQCHCDKDFVYAVTW